MIWITFIFLVSTDLSDGSSSDNVPGPEVAPGTNDLHSLPVIIANETIYPLTPNPSPTENKTVPLFLSEDNNSSLIMDSSVFQYTGSAVLGGLDIYNATIVLNANSVINVQGGDFSMVSSSLVIIPSTTPLLVLDCCPLIINSSLIVNFNPLSPQTKIEIMQFNSNGTVGGCNINFSDISVENVNKCYNVRFTPSQNANAFYILPDIMDLCATNKGWVLPIIICSCLIVGITVIVIAVVVYKKHQRIKKLFSDIHKTP